LSKYTTEGRPPLQNKAAQSEHEKVKKRAKNIKGAACFLRVAEVKPPEERKELMM